ncbi:hypothetical protein CEXT_479141 [Caerostris extrusa]|uniref:Uncharacterized protein n=1 Tax=Caerostris extrusa TaxID=172846 RepID=A0AAV4R6J9_CAEEX|nr:hypothetical protein CEXT_479141 [Caerostris extrusa]
MSSAESPQKRHRMNDFSIRDCQHPLFCKGNRTISSIIQMCVTVTLFFIFFQRGMASILPFVTFRDLVISAVTCHLLGIDRSRMSRRRVTKPPMRAVCRRNLACRLSEKEYWVKEVGVRVNTSSVRARHLLADVISVTTGNWFMKLTFLTSHQNAYHAEARLAV